MSERCACGSYAINEHLYDRQKGHNSHLCDVCYWQHEARQAHRDATEEVAKAHKRGWEQAKMEAVRIAKQKAGHVGYPIDCCQEDYENYLIGSDIADAIAAMKYKEPTKSCNVHAQKCEKSARHFVKR